MTEMPAIRAGLADLPADVDLVVVGLGITGVGVALDAAARGMSVLAVDAHDLAFGTSRWSSKLVHGGLRYLANGQFGVAHESAVERGILMEVTAPHLTHPMGMLTPLAGVAPVVRAGLLAGDVLRRTAGTPPSLLPPARRIPAAEALALAPGLRRSGLKGAMLSWDGQLVDDARLVCTLARTAAAHGAQLRTKVRFEGLHDGAVQLRAADGVHQVRARAVINAAGVWAGQVSEGFGTSRALRLKPSRGTHVVLKPRLGDPLSQLRVAVTVPIPGSLSRFAFMLPQPDDTIFVGLTDEPTDSIPDVPQPTEVEIGFLLDVVSGALEQPLRRSDVAGAFAGLRPLLEATGSTADLSRRHAVLTDSVRSNQRVTQCVTIVGGKLTTYRRMAQDAVDAVSFASDFDDCTTSTLPLSGAASREVLADLAGPRRLVERYGTDAALVLANAQEISGLSTEELIAPIAPGISATLAEFIFGVTHEGATDVDDLLQRRTRVSLVPSDLPAAVPAAERALAAVAATRT